MKKHGEAKARKSLMDPVGAVREAMNWIASDAIPEEGAGDDEDGHASKSGDQASARMSGRNSLMDPVGAIRESMNWLASDAIPEEGEEGGAPYGSGDNDSDEEDEDEDGDVVRESMMGNPSALLHPIQAMRDTMDGYKPMRMISQKSITPISKTMIMMTCVKYDGEPEGAIASCPCSKGRG